MKIEDINKKIKELNKLKKLLKAPDDNTVEQKIYKKYLETENVKIVAVYINELGYRIHGRKYIANDISDIIKSKDIKVKNMELKKVVIKIFNSHKKGIKYMKW